MFTIFYFLKFFTGYLLVASMFASKCGFHHRMAFNTRQLRYIYSLVHEFVDLQIQFLVWRLQAVRWDVPITEIVS